MFMLRRPDVPSPGKSWCSCSGGQAFPLLGRPGIHAQEARRSLSWEDLVFMLRRPDVPSPGKTWCSCSGGQAFPLLVFMRRRPGVPSPGKTWYSCSGGQTFPLLGRPGVHAQEARHSLFRCLGQSGCRVIN